MDSSLVNNDRIVVGARFFLALNDDTHYMGAELEQHTLTDADGNSVTVTQTTNGDYYFRDDNGTGFTDNGDGTWSDENGNNYTEN